MGNCIHRCFGVIDRRRRYLRSKYAAEKDFSIEFENLMDEEPPRDEMTRGQLELECGPFTVSSYVRMLAQQEQEIEREEEEYYEAKREAARIAKLNKDKELASKSNPANRGWVNEDEWEVAGAEDDFENFLASVKARSLATISQVKNGSGDAQSTTSSNAHTKDKSLTEGSSLDMEWDHEAGMSPQRKLAARVSEDSWSKPSTTSPIHSSDLEWDPDFVSADDGERIQLISAASKQAGVSSR
ncbi:AP-1 complex-associated regulatory protein isoform X2 [Aplysia californica]|uniref:AP-1 complex-associated regulatory protein isoform X2 n=1 Tax=Aplysia californica TaxID=6500 RepID=A0ABM1VVU0_APLCA|nr:AP-1 complex-associated regulatory protein isoform X2 [Aplysia californica]